MFPLAAEDKTKTADRQWEAARSRPEINMSPLCDVQETQWTGVKLYCSFSSKRDYGHFTAVWHNTDQTEG